jgi:hypothetical protein
VSEPRLELVRTFADDRWAAHRHLFAHRHPDESPQAHRDLVKRIHGREARLNVEGFRGFAKTTYLEEAAVLRALYGEFHNMVIVGASFARACDRVDAIAHELANNPLITNIFGPQKGEIWGASRIVLTSGVCIQALGRGTSTTGIKFREWRPDSALIDDVEDPEEKRNDAERFETWLWLIRTFLPSLDDPVETWVRALGTRRGRNSLPERLEDTGWPTVKYPIEHIDEGGSRAPTWPAKFPLKKIDEMKRDYRGDMHTWSQEYMCEAVNEADRVFGPIAAEPRVRPDYLPVYAMYDPARTAHQKSATTGIAVWSWRGSRLTFWRLSGETWLPDEIIADLFRVAREYRPVWIGFEEDGLNEWALQPIRLEMIRRHVMLPLKPVRAPRNKFDFIKGLQPYASRGEIEFAGLPEDFQIARDQFMSFPRGRIDAPNAAAYALTAALGAGTPVYDFDDECVVADLEPIEGGPLYLAGNADGRVVTAVLCQHIEGEIRVLADWVREGMASEVVSEIHAEAALLAETGAWTTVEVGDDEQPYKLPERLRRWRPYRLRWVVPARHGEIWNNVGLVQAIRAIPQGVTAAPAQSEERGRVYLAERLGHRDRGRLSVSVSAAASWTLRGLAGGDFRRVGPSGLPEPVPERNLYRVLIEGLEAFVGVGAGTHENVEDRQPVAYTRGGTPYKSAMPDHGIRR